MKCPKCNGTVQSVDIAHNNKDNEIYRKRLCTECQFEFYTVEFEVEDNAQFRKAWNKHHRRSYTPKK